MRLLSTIDTERPIIITSPVKRAKETAYKVRRGLGPLLPWPLIEDVRLRESVSIFDGKRVPEVAALRENWKHLRRPSAPSWGESYESVASRMKRAMDLTAKCANSEGVPDTVMVSHQLPIWVLRLSVEGRPWSHDPAARQCGHASITTFVIEDGDVAEIRYWENPIH